MLRTLFIFAILVPGLALAITSRYAALLVYVWYALFRPQDWIWVNIGALRLSLVLSVLTVVPWAWIVTKRTAPEADRVAREAWPNLTHPLSLGTLLFLAAAVVAQMHAVDPATGWFWLDYLWRLLLVSLVLVTLVSRPDRLTILVAVMAMSIGFHSSKAGLVSAVAGGRKILDGFGGAYVDNNGYAMAMVMILPLLVAAGQNIWNRWLRLPFFAAVPATAFAVVCTYSRGGFLALSASILTFVALQRRRALALSLIVPAGMLAYLYAMPAGYADRLKTIQTYEEVNEDSALGRLHFWRVAVDMVQAHPYGVGLHNYEAAYDRFDFSGGRYGRRRSVHSSHLQVLAETGYAGAIIWTGMFGCAFWVSWRIRARSRTPGLPQDVQRLLFTMSNALITSMVGFLVGGAFLALALNDLTWMTFGLVAALDRMSKKLVAEHATAAVSAWAGGTVAAGTWLPQAGPAGAEVTR